MPAITPGAPLHSFLNAICVAASDVLSQALSAPWKTEINTTDGLSADVSSLQSFQLSISGGLQGNASIQVETKDALLLAQKFLAEPVDHSADLNPERKEALLELLRQVAGAAATVLKAQFGESKLEVNIGEPPTWQGVDVTLLASESSAGQLTLGLRLNSELLASVSSVTTPATPPEPGPKVQSPAAVSEPNLDLLLGVNLNLTLRFGKRTLPLREIVDLNSGSVIELDCRVEDPAELLLGDKLIARGQVVIVDGNYGLRITEMADARQRVAAL